MQQQIFCTKAKPPSFQQSVNESTSSLSDIARSAHLYNEERLHGDGQTLVNQQDLDVMEHEQLHEEPITSLSKKIPVGRNLFQLTPSVVPPPPIPPNKVSYSVFKISRT